MNPPARFDRLPLNHPYTEDDLQEAIDSLEARVRTLRNSRMNKTWTLKDDIFLASCEDMIPDWHNFVAAHDLGFTGKDAGFKRYQLLKETGVWGKLQDFIRAETILHGWHTLAFSRSEDDRDLAFADLEAEGLPVPDFMRQNKPKAKQEAAE